MSTIENILNSKTMPDNLALEVHHERLEAFSQPASLEMVSLVCEQAKLADNNRHIIKIIINDVSLLSLSGGDWETTDGSDWGSTPMGNLFAAAYLLAFQAAYSMPLHLYQKSAHVLGEALVVVGCNVNIRADSETIARILLLLDQGEAYCKGLNETEH